MEKTCMNCGRSACDHKDAMRCSNGNALWIPDSSTPNQAKEENAPMRDLAAPEALEKCPACGDHAARKVQQLECISCGCALISDWERPPSSPIEALLAEYAAECSDFSGQSGYEFALTLARRYAERGPDSQMRCVVHTLLSKIEAHDARLVGASELKR